MAQDAEKSESIISDIEVKPGLHWTDWDDYRGKVGEYEQLERGIRPDVGISVHGQTDYSYFDLQGFYYEDMDNSFHGDIDLLRILDVQFSYFRMPHFLEHDPLTNLDACFCSGGGAPVPAATEFEDLNAGDEYYLRYSRMDSTTTVRLPFLPGSEIFVDYRKEQRHGYRQATTLSKCSSCHVVGQSRDIDEYTEDFNPGFRTKFGNKEKAWFTLSYDYLKRRFGETGDDPEHYYNPAVHPGGSGDVFTNRTQFSDVTLPYNVIPSSEKDTHTIKLHGQFPTITTYAYTSYVNSSTKNMHEQNKSDLESFVARITNALVPGLIISGKFRTLDIKNDDVFIHVNERVGTAGPQAGQTYSQVYPEFVPEFYRKSALNRTIYETELSAKYKLMKYLTLDGKFKWTSTDRDYYEVEPGDTKTDEYTGRIGLTYRKSNLNGYLYYEHESISDPFANLQAACNPSGTNLVPDATPFNGLQYFLLYGMRQQTLGNLPDTKDQVKASLSWIISPMVSLNAYYRYISESNDFDWDQKSHIPSVSLWIAPSPNLFFTVYYLYNYQKTDSIICEPVFNG
jgi:hypothetical protein